MQHTSEPAILRFVGQRLLQLIPVAFGITVVVFLLVRLIPGDPALAILGSHATPASIARVRAQLGLNNSIFAQYSISYATLSPETLATHTFTRRAQPL